jgi:predicted flap endonuclease-1-like 5' DNA nuclease
MLHALKYILLIALILFIVYYIGVRIARLFCKKQTVIETPPVEPLAPVAEPTTERSPTRQPDDLTLISGIGNVLQKRLNDMGIFHFDQIAQWSISDAEHVSQSVGFKGRAIREKWIEQATVLAKRDKN